MQAADYCCIPLATQSGTIQGHTLVDAIDRPALAFYRWVLHSGGYASRSGLDSSGKRRTWLMHRELLGLTHGDRREGDHINRDRLDNRRVNLRIATRSQNAQNQGAHSDSTSRFRGVYWDKGKARWRARIGLDGRYYHLGYHRSEIAAAQAVDSFLRENAPLVVRDLAA